ncbi:MAG: adenosylmethionine--8-amino-7-oxononanoate transaminase [Bacteroidota bacterium]
MQQLSELTQIGSSFSEQQLAFDRDHIWHPYTSLTHPLPTYPVVSASGVRLKLDDGKELIDGMSSWWTAIHGYNVPELNKAAHQQLKQMAHVMFGGITHPPAIQLAEKLVEITPEPLTKVFFSDSGSVSVEVAMKMAIQFQHAKGKRNRTKFLTVKNGYHGDTTAAMSVCDPQNGMHHLFSEFLPKHFFANALAKKYGETCEQSDLNDLSRWFKEYSEEIAAFIIEPIVQGAGGMWFYSKDYLKHIRHLCDQYDILLIADEIATGFGRSGKLFACEHAEIAPDVLCLGKALTGGYLSFAATLCSSHVAETICQGEAGVFMHGPTFMGNPLACSIANKSIELLFQSSWQEQVRDIAGQLQEELNEALQYASVHDVRVLGAIGVIETKEPVNVAEAQKFFVERGVWIRPFRNLIYIMPPYITSSKDLSQISTTMIAYCHRIS